MIDKKKAEVGRRRRFLGKMEKKFRGKLLLLGCLLLAIIPSIVYADYYSGLKVETYPVVGSTDVTRGVEFRIRVVACNEDEDPLTSGSSGWGYASSAHIILYSDDDPNAWIKNDFGSWVPLPASGYKTNLDGDGDKIFDVILNTVGDDKKITVEQNTDYVSGVSGDFLNFKVHDFVDHFVVDPVPPQTAGVPFNITIYAIDASENIAETFNDNVNIRALKPPEYTYHIYRTPTTIAGSSFTNGVAIIPVTIYGSHPVSRLVKIKCENTVMHGGNYAEGEIEVRVDPNSYEKILLLVEGEEHLPGSLDPDGKQGVPSPPWTAGVASPVDVYLTDEWWNPIQDSDIPPGTAITFSSSDDPITDLPNLPIMWVNPDTFQVTFYTANPAHWIRIEEGTTPGSVSVNIPVDPDTADYFEFDADIGDTQYTTQPFQINVTAYDESGNVAIAYNALAQVTCSIGEQYITNVGPPGGNNIQFSGGRATAWVQITKRVMGMGVTVTVTAGSNSVTSNPFQVYAGPFTELLVLLTGEVYTAGLENGKAPGSPPTQINAGESTTVTIYATDTWWNIINTSAQINDIRSLTGHIDPPTLPFTLVDGVGECQVTFTTARTAAGINEPQTIRVSGDGRFGDSTPLIVRPGPFDRLVLVAPGEQLDPGTFALNGKTDDPADTQTAGVSFDNLIVAATDEYWNPVDSGFPDYIRFYTSYLHEDLRFAGSLPYTSKAMDNGIENYSDNTLITLASPQWVRVYGWTPATGYRYGLANIDVTHGPLDGFVFDEIQSPITAGEPIDVTITAKDQYGNTVESFENHIISLTSDKEPVGQYTFSPRLTEPFSNGVSNFTLRVYKVDTDVKLTARQWLFSGMMGVFLSGWYEGTSNSFDVEAGDYAGLILLLDPPNQVHEPGNIWTQGKRGVPCSPDGYTVGDPAVEAKVYAVDAYWNRVHPPDPEPLIELTTARYMDVGPANPWSMGNGEFTFWTSFRTAGNGQVLVARDIDPANDISDSSTINVNPGAFTKLQIIVPPGENPDPGSNPSGSGKTGSPLPQVAGVSFDLAVRAVDNYWNLVPINSESIDLISQIDVGLDSRYPPQPFEAGVSTFTIWLDGKNQDVDVTAIKLTPPFLSSNEVMIFVRTGYEYEVVVPTYCTAGYFYSNTFTMTVRLLDDNGDVVTDASNYFQMTPHVVGVGSPAQLGVETYKLEGGSVTFQQSYPIVEKIFIEVSDGFNREPVPSHVIDVRETALEYRVYVPTQSPVAVAEEFEITVSLIDTGTENVVPTKDRRVNLVPLSSAEPGGEGRLYVNSGVLSRGTLTITNQWYTKAEWIQIGASDAEIYDPPAGDRWSDPFQILPGTLERLQILAPIEIPRPGEWAYVSTGKDSSGLLVQDTEIEFPVTVRAVDQYWNLVDFDGGSVYLSSDNSFSSQPGKSSLDNGEATFQVTIHQSGSSFTLKAEAEQPTDLQPQRVTIPMEVAVYRATSTVSGAMTVDSFLLTIELLDSAGLPKQGADNSFILTPYTVNYEDAPGKLTVTPKSPALENGYAQVSVNYDTAGKIRIKVSDSFGRPEAYTELIDIQPVGLRYEVVAPEKVEAGKEFTVTVKLIDTGAGNVVTLEEYDRQVKLDAYYPDETLAEGKLKVRTLYLEGGEKTILQSYNLAEDIYIEASDASTSPSATSDRTGNIEVYGAPKTVMELDGVYNEMNGAIYLRGSTLVKILCVSEIEAETILYRDNGAGWRTYDEPFGLSPGGHTIEYYGIDNYGHKEEINKSKTIYVSFFSDGVDGVSNRPNPFKAGREETLIEYNLEQPSNVTITIYDLLGQEVWHESYAAGEDGGSTANSVSWDGRNLSGKVVANGGYICRIWIQREKKHMVRKIGVAK